jgi:hypothetical protein
MFGGSRTTRFSPVRADRLVCAACALFALTSAMAAGPTVWDSPAIDVFPEHGSVLIGKQTLKDFLADGRLFVHNSTYETGPGRPTGTSGSKPTIRRPVSKIFQRIAGPDANSCSGCRNQSS